MGTADPCAGVYIYLKPKFFPLKIPEVAAYADGRRDYGGFLGSAYDSVQNVRPLLLISLIVGLIIAVLQAATQIHEQTLTFVPKLIAIAVVLFLSGPWVFAAIRDFT
jgi:flagellar biosynthetic protein FliQ